jgi:superfamily II DNA or RNA helicase
MSFDFSKISKQKPKLLDPDWSNPVVFFYKLQHPEIKDLFPVQRDVLKGWFTEYKAGLNDKLVSLNTGGGKTLIGLMIAESIRRDSQGKVLYICPNIFLGKQTVDEAKKYGIPTSSYLKSEWVDGALFLKNDSVCITNYQSLLNPRSVFKDMEIAGVIFDDAHLSLDLLDEQYSIKTTDFSVICEIANVFQFSPSIKEKINSIKERDPLALIMIPPIEWHALLKILPV